MVPHGRLGCFVVFCRGERCSEKERERERKGEKEKEKREFFVGLAPVGGGGTPPAIRAWGEAESKKNQHIYTYTHTHIYMYICKGWPIIKTHTHYTAVEHKMRKNSGRVIRNKY